MQTTYKRSCLRPRVRGLLSGEPHQGMILHLRPSFLAIGVGFHTLSGVHGPPEAGGKTLLFAN